MPRTGDKIVLLVIRRIFIALLLSLTLASGFSAQKRKNKKDTEPPTQVLPPLPEPPEAIVADTARLSFQVSPLSNKGLLSQQIRDALKALLHDNHGAQIVKLRAFVAGSGDLRRVQQIVAEEFTDKKLSLPVVSTIQVGALPLVGAQVVIEAVSLEKQASANGTLKFLPLIVKKDTSTAVHDLQLRSNSFEIVEATCFVSSLDDAAALRTALVTAFTKATVDIVQTQRQSLQPFTACEGVGRGALSGQIALTGSNPGILATLSGNVPTPKIIFTASKLVFRDQDADVRLAFQRLIKAIEPMGATKDDVVWTGEYALTNPIDDKIALIRLEFTGSFAVKKSGTVLFEGLPSTDATAAIEMIAMGH